MKKLIFPVLLFLICLTSAAQQDNQGCKASFTWEPDVHNSLKIHFVNQSIGQAYSCDWYFGDGSPVNHEKDPVHSYFNWGGYMVHLTIHTSDFCSHDTVIEVNVFNQSNCEARYNYNHDNLNPLMYFFTDMSTSVGHVTHWHWDFGDGASSGSANPMHVFPTYGSYVVCLTISDNSNPPCQSTRCDTIRIDVPCKAQFIYSLDSMNRTPLVYHFNSTSTGNPTQYKWQFEGGITYATPNVTHHFPASGSYDVCLTIIKKAGSQVVCSDTACILVHTAKYFDLGGHLYAGKLPINNPVSTGDTGTAFLFRRSADRLVPVDTSRFTYLGYYAFPQVLSGSYLVKCALTPGSANYRRFVPAYYPYAMTWLEAENVNLIDSNQYSAHVEMIASDSMIAGRAKIEGKVVIGEPGMMNPPVPGAQVLLLNSQRRPVEFMISGHDGRYEFDNLGYGSYFLYVEVPGRYSRYTAIWLDSTKEFAQNVILGVYDHDVTGIGENAASDFASGHLYPNPVNDMAQLNINLEKPMIIRVEVADIRTSVITAFDKSCPQGFSKLSIPVATLAPGIYFVRIRSLNGNGSFVQKLVKY